jgi:hypothetical protein
MDSEVLVHGQLVQLHLGQWQCWNIMKESHSGEKMFTSWKLDIKRSQKGTKGTTAKIYPLRHVPRDPLLQLGAPSTVLPPPNTDRIWAFTIVSGNALPDIPRSVLY